MSEMDTVTKIMEIFVQLTDKQKKIAIEWADEMVAENAEKAKEDGNDR